MQFFKRLFRRTPKPMPHRAEVCVLINGVRVMHQGFTTNLMTLTANVKRDGVYIECPGVRSTCLRAGESLTVMVGPQ